MIIGMFQFIHRVCISSSDGHGYVSVYPDGRVCISILHAPGDDPMGYESSAERWSPVQSVEKILLSVFLPAGLSACLPVCLWTAC